MSALPSIDDLFLPYQLEYLKDQSRLKILEKSRRIGGTYVQAFEDVLDCIDEPGLKVFFSSADITAAAEYGDYIAAWITKLNAISYAMRDLDEEELQDIRDFQVADEDKGIKVKLIEFLNGSKIYLLSSNPKAFRSKGGKIVWDEAAWHEQDAKMWAAAKPAAMWGYAIRILSTHNGVKSVFNQLIQKAKQLKNWSHHRVTILDAVAQGLLDRIKGRKTTRQERKDWLAEERAGCLDESQWQQEYMCNPQDESTALLSYKAISAMERPGLLMDLEKCQGELYVGFDVARRRHLSVIYVLEKLGLALYCRRIEVLEKMTFRMQREVLFSILSNPRVRRSCIDATGIGMQLAEEAKEEFGSMVEEVMFSPSVKESLAIGLQRESDDGELFLAGDMEPKAQQLQTEGLHAVRKFVTAANNSRYDAAASDKGHGDHFWALALACHAARDKTSGATEAVSAPANAKDEDAQYSPDQETDPLDQNPGGGWGQM